MPEDRRSPTSLHQHRSGRPAPLPCPLEPQGLTAAWLARRRGLPFTWHAPWLTPAPRVSPHDLLAVRLGQRARLLRWSRHGEALRPPLLPGAIAASILHGQVDLAWQLLDAWVAGSVPDERLIARGRTLSRWHQRSLRRWLQSDRPWPAARFAAPDLPAALVPAALELRRQLGLPRPRLLISGGHQLAPGPWTWHRRGERHWMPVWDGVRPSIPAPG